MKSKVLTVVVSVLVSIFLAEIALRLADLSYPEFNRLDFRLGWSPRPGVEGIIADERRVRMRINAEGFRDLDHAVIKPPAAFRLALLGDSLTEGREVALGDTYWKVMERRLAECLAPSGRAVEVLSFAVNGYGTAQQLIVADEFVWKYDPDVLLLAFFTGNDVWNNSRALDGHADRPYYVLVDGALVLDDSGPGSFRFLAKKTWADVKHTLYNVLRTVQVGRQAYKRIKSRLRHRDATVADQLASGLDSTVYLPPADRVWREAWAVTEEMIRELARRARSHGADFRLVTLSNPIQVYPDAALRDRLATALGTDDLLYPDRRLARLAGAEGIPVVTLAETLRAHAEATGVHLHGGAGSAGGHWNRAGHRVAGEALAERLCAAYAKAD